MSSLWRACYSINNKNNITPSPTLKRVLSNPNSRAKKNLKRVSIERTSVLASLRGRGAAAGMTVEASLLLPMVLFFFLHIMSAVEMLRLHGKLCFALWECGKQLSVYAVIPGEIEEKIPDIAVSYFYVGNRVKAFL